MTEQISKDEAAIYDRQIRLWGLDAQQRIRKARILMAGMRALSNEVCKNLVLAGIASITLLDHETVTAFDLGGQFLINETCIGQNKAEAASASIKNLNPRVEVVVDQQDMREKPDAYFESFDIVCLVHSDHDFITHIDQIRRNVKKPFYAADTFGWFGYIFCDLTEHTYIVEKKLELNSKQAPVAQKIEQVATYTSFNDSLQKNWSDMRIKVLKRRITPMTFLIHILFQFQKEYKRSPTEQDIDTLIQNKPQYLKNMGIEDQSVLDNELLRQLASLFDTEIAPVAAIVGGVLAQDILRTLSANELPIQNWFYYNGIDGTGLVHQV
ncbi:SUMO-activating enzyme subunit 1-like protein [Gilbertella persicaria]|uniref:SUMO-activating enzyme subunit 1-like protein n=1 Tax=Gilbertella persicaria TaxID=101096 RepID=UPI00222094CC|nr:SUMO-activating enzyme subunit 1-like protein [Gilbertella persicaria]KAI8069845.1 SUMO-activating enzyme subunit 1-like protein [Gilbertella persicaria]